MWLDQSNQALPRHHPIQRDQEQLLAGLLALASVLGVGEGHLLHRETRWVGSRYFAKSESLFQSFPRLTSQALDRNHPSPYPARSASSNKCRTTPGGCRFPGGLRQISWIRFSRHGMGKDHRAPLRNSTITGEMG